MGAASASSTTSSASLAYDALRPPAYSDAQSHFIQDQDYRYAPRSTFAPLPPPPRDDPLAPGASRLRYPPPSLPRPMMSLSSHIRLGDKLSPSAFSTAKLGGPTTPKRATDEERRAKHREAQRRFVKRKKIEMTQLKQLAVELEKRHDLLQALSEQEALAHENQTLMQQLESQKAQESPTSSSQPEDKQVARPDEMKEELREEDERPAPEIKWEARTFEW
ncbi:hypothetical protein PRNP1_007585 [Phytophthora ramorum]